jgi:uncharacterized protein (DUF2141 family)
MQNRFYNCLFILVVAIVLVNCANRGTPSGGEKDIEPPKIIKSVPENFSTNFTAKEIKIYFDEYIKLKKISKQLVISPPMKKTPEITPASAASKYIRIKIYDTLQPNTTYAFNFGNSIVDNNEENPFKYYRYVFSTGDFIDSLTVKGRILDAVNFKTDEFVSVALYEADSTYTDSLIYKEVPKYITNTLDSVTTFSIENVRAGKYMLRALKDGNSDNKFQSKIDKIAFLEDPITVPTEEEYELKLFSEAPEYKASKPRYVAGEKIIFGYEGDYKNMKIELLSKISEYKSRYFKDEKTDTLNYYFSPKIKADSLVYKVSNATVIDTFTVRIKDEERDSLMVNTFPKGNINFKEDFTVYANIPFTALNEKKISILDKDSLAVPFKTAFDTLRNTYKFSFDKTEENTYKIQMLPEALTDFFENKNDTLNFSLRTKSKSSYSNVRVKIHNAKYPIIVQLTDEKGDVKAEQYASEAKPLDFEYLDSKTYYLRVIFDTNKNGVYDTGNYLKQQQPERISYSEKAIEARSGWDEVIDFTLSD